MIETNFIIWDLFSKVIYGLKVFETKNWHYTFLNFGGTEPIFIAFAHLLHVLKILVQLENLTLTLETHFRLAKSYSHYNFFHWNFWEPFLCWEKTCCIQNCFQHKHCFQQIHFFNWLERLKFNFSQDWMVEDSTNVASDVRRQTRT